MKRETQVPITQRSGISDYRDMLALTFAFAGPDAGQIEWLLDRIEGNRRVSGWA